jgi:predicted ATPase/transcriptional regulator with XRE-family HTH domain
MADEAGAGFGELLRRQRRAAGLTQEELAARAGLSARGIADLERGARRTPRRDTVAMLVRALGGDPEDEATWLAASRRPPAQAVPAARADGGAASPPAGAAPDASGGTQQAAPRDRMRHNLSVQPTPLLGREADLRAVAALVRRADVRLVTLSGPGGVGKTRLSIAVGAALLDDFADGVYFVRLSRLTDPALVLPTIAQTLGVREAGGQPIAETLRNHLRESCLLLVLDNCEQVAAAGPELADLLAVCPALTLLATSRAALRLQGEHEYPVPPLGVPPITAVRDSARAPERLTEYPAAALFVERARAARPDFALTAANAPAVAAICARLDGLPLAIELAAARVKLLPPAALLARLEHGLGMLAGGARDLAERQQAIRSTIAWSENLLATEERVLFRRLAIFAGGCTLEAAERVCVAPEGVEPLGIDLLDGLSTLVDQSLVQPREEDGEPRFGMLHVIREYALERLEEESASTGRAPEAEALRRAHAANVMALSEEAEPELTGPRAGMWLSRLEREHDNLRAALDWARERGELETGLRLAAAVFRFWMVRGHLREGRVWVESLLALEAEEATGEPATVGARVGGVRARALRAAGVLALYQGDQAAAGVWLEQATALGRVVGDPLTVANALSSLGTTAMHQGDLERAGACLEESLALMRAVGERRDIAAVQINLGIVVYLRDDLERAETCFVEALALARPVGDRDLIATALANLASVALRLGNVAEGEALGREALALYRDLGDPRRCAVGLEGLASSSGMAGQAEHAARLLGAAAALRAAVGAPLPANELADIEQAVAEARAALGEEAWAAAFAAGEALALEAAIAEALGDETHTVAVSDE